MYACINGNCITFSKRGWVVNLCLQLKKSYAVLDIIITKRINQSVILTNLCHAPVPTREPYINFISAYYVLLGFGENVP
jgi:hypothetical protein